METKHLKPVESAELDAIAVLTVLALQIRTVAVLKLRSVEITVSVDLAASVPMCACVWVMLKSTSQHPTSKLMPGSME